MPDHNYRITAWIQSIDDIWDENKIESLIIEMLREEGLVCQGLTVFKVFL